MKDFDRWNDLKKIQDGKDRAFHSIFCKERDILWILLGINVGDEEDGKGKYFERPVLVIRKFNNHLFWGCALSTKLKEDNKYYKVIQTKNGPRSVIISQLRLYDTKRLRGKLGVATQEDFQKIKTALRELL